MTLNDYFDKIILISLVRATDRLDQCVAQFQQHGIENILYFDAYDMPTDENRGCTASHRAALDLIAYHEWDRTLILEDDFQVVHDNFQERFAEAIVEVPDDWQMLYLGGHFAEDPIRRVSPHVVRCAHMKTTSSYAVTYAQARLMAPFICGHGPIDELYSTYNRDCNTYILDPRLMVQRECYSYIQGHVMNNALCMLDPHHLARMDARPA